MRRLFFDPHDPGNLLCPQYCALDLGGAGRQGARHGQFGIVDDPGDVHQRDRPYLVHFFKTTGRRCSLSKLRQQSVASEYEMSPLRRALKRPEFYLAVLVFMLVLGVLDSFRRPETQVTARIYVASVHGYQVAIRPWLSRYVRCRYQPTCSVYSAEAVRRWGIRHGLLLTWRRVASCRQTVALGTFDPVPVPPR